MVIILKEIEPFNIPPVDNNAAAMFMKHLTGNENFEYNGSNKSKSVVFYDLIYKYTRLIGCAVAVL